MKALPLTQTGLPVIRDELVSTYHSFPLKDGPSKFEGQVAALRKADLYALSQNASEVAREASCSMADVHILSEDMPSQHGLILLPRGFDEVKSTDGLKVSAIFWMTLNHVSPKTLLVIPLFETSLMPCKNPRCKRPHGTLRKAGEWWIPLDSRTTLPMHSAENADVIDESRLIEFLYTAWIFMQQSELTTVSPVNSRSPNPKRKGEMKTHKVSVIDMRRYEPTVAAPGGNSREHDHRWIVSGHWRNQWYPKRGINKPKWIPAYIKGPEGAPVRHVEKVHALRSVPNPEALANR